MRKQESSHRCRSRARRVLALLAGMLTAAPVAAQSQPAPPSAQSQPVGHIGQAALLHRLIDLGRLSMPPDPGERMVRGVYSPGEQPNEWVTALDANGPGALVHTWAVQPTGEVQIEIDGALAVDGPLAALFDGSRSPFQAPFAYLGPSSAANCWMPMGFSKRCEVRVRNGPAQAAFTAVQLPASQRVEPFNAEFDETARAAVEAVSKVLTDGYREGDFFRDVRRSDYSIAAELSAKSTLVEAFPGPGTIRAISLALTDRVVPRHDPYALHRATIRIFFDGAEQPAVEAPLIDFFGSGFGFQPFESLPVGTGRMESSDDLQLAPDRYLYCFFPMPFERSARIEIAYPFEVRGGARPLAILLRVGIDPTPPPENSLRFHARFRRAAPDDAAFRLLASEGPGRLVGVVLNADTPRTGWWGIEPLLAQLDGASLELVADAGELMAAGAPWETTEFPFHGITRAGRFGKASGYRWWISESPVCQQSMELVLQRTAPRAEEYRSATVFWYATPSAARTYRRLRAEDLSPFGLRIPGSVEVEGSIQGDGWGNVIHQRHAGGVELSGESGALLSTDDPVRIRVSTGGRDRGVLKLRVSPRRPFRSIEVRQGEKLLAALEYDREKRDGVYAIGPVDFSSGDRVLTVQARGNPLLDCWIFEPQAGQ